MAMLSVCDGCGKQQAAESNGVSWFKPRNWFERTCQGEGGEIITACSRECIQALEKKRKEEGKQSTTVVLPI